MARGEAADAEQFIVSVSWLAALFHVTEKTIAEWRKLGMPHYAHGKYRLTDCVVWRRQRDLEAAKGGDGDLTEERRRLIVEQRRGHEIANAQQAEELLPAEEVMTDMLAFASVVASQLDALPQRLAPRLVAMDDPEDVRRTLSDECRSIRVAASEAFAAYGHSLADGEADGAAARPRRRRVGRRPPDAADREPGAGAVAD